MDNETFWMVWSPQGQAPTRKHLTRASAVTEAERLARLNAGNEFYVLQAIEGRRVDGMQRVHLQGPEVPF